MSGLRAGPFQAGSEHTALISPSSLALTLDPQAELLVWLHAARLWISECKDVPDKSHFSLKNSNVLFFFCKNKLLGEMGSDCVTGRASVLQDEKALETSCTVT